MILAVLALATGCAATAPNIDSQAELAKASNGNSHPVVFGKLEFVRNGEQVELGEVLPSDAMTRARSGIGTRNCSYTAFASR